MGDVKQWIIRHRNGHDRIFESEDHVLAALIETAWTSQPVRLITPDGAIFSVLLIQAPGDRT